MVVGDVTTGTEVVVIGAGPGGYVAAIRAGQLGLDVTLVEKEKYGGTCLNHGCIPSKALISATDVAHDAKSAAEMGIDADLDVDLGRMMEWKGGVVDQLTGGVEKLCKANGVNLIEGRAEFADEETVRVAHAGEGQGSESLRFEHAIVATGSQPIEIPGFSFAADPVLDSRQALAIEEIPDSLVVVGAGYIGMELSTVFAKLGTDVTVIEMLDSALPTYEDDVARVVKSRAEDLGVEFRFERTATGWEEHDEGITVATEPAESEANTDAASADTASDGGTATEDAESVMEGDDAASAGVEEFDADRVLVAVGRAPVTDTLNLDAIGLEPDESGFLATDDRARTDAENVLAVGDVAGEPMLAHVGSKEGEVAAEVIAGEPAALDFQGVPAAVFTDPEIGTVGLTEAEAEAEGFAPIVGQMPLRASGRALTLGESDGFVRIVADERSKVVLGAQIVGPEASELIAELGLAIEMGATVEDLSATIHTHPTLSEAVMEAAANAQEKAIHTLNR